MGKGKKALREKSGIDYGCKVDEIIWSQDLVECVMQNIAKCSLKALDAIQLALGIFFRN